MSKNPKLNKPHQPILNWLNKLEREITTGKMRGYRDTKALIGINKDLLEIIVKHRTHQDLIHDFTNTLIKYNAAILGVVMAKKSTKAPEEFTKDE